MSQVCNTCFKKLELDKFQWDKNRPSPRKICKKCKSKKEWKRIISNKTTHQHTLVLRKLFRETNPKSIQNSKLKDKYNITFENKLDLIINQNNKCAICSTVFSDSRNTHVDHDHKTGVVRGILCNKCNSGLGMFKDNILFLQEAVKYLEKSLKLASCGVERLEKCSID